MDTSGIADAEGMENAVFTYRWMAGGTDIPNATGASHTLTEDDEGLTIQVWVSFTDDCNPEVLTSAATDAVAPAPPPLTVSLRGAAPAIHDGSTEFTFEIEFSEEFPLSYKKLKLHTFDLTDGEVLKAKRVLKSSNIPWRITVRPGSNADVTVVLPVTTRCGAQGAICTRDGRKLSNSLNFTASGPANKGPNMRICRGGFRRPEPTRVSRYALPPEAPGGNQRVRRPSGGGSRRDEAQASRAPQGHFSVGVDTLLDQLGISQNGLARRSGHSPAHLSLPMAGRRGPSPRTRRWRRQVLGVSDFYSLFILEPAED